MNNEPFSPHLRYGDDCPVCGNPVKAVVVSESKNGPRVYNGECSEYKSEGASRHIFHQDFDS